MSMLYLTENLLTGDDVTLYQSSEDTLYVVENIYCGRPSKPFRTTGVGAAGSPEYVAVQFNAPKSVNFFGLFNHNLTALAGGDDALLLKGSGYAHAAANWASPDYSIDLADRLITGWNDIYKLIGYASRTYRLEVIDTLNANGYIELGELFLGNFTELSNARVQPGRQESPELHWIRNKTAFGQHWTEALAHSAKLRLELWNLNDPAQLDSVRTMITAIHSAGGHFVIVPDSSLPFAYYVALANDGGFMQSVARGLTSEVSSWTLELETLTKGIILQ